MNITDVRIRKVEERNRLKALASITIDGVFVVHELRIINGKNGLFVSMPSKSGGPGNFKDIAHPINTETRRQIETLVLERYNELEQN